VALADVPLVRAAQLVSAVVFPVPDGPDTITPRRAETWCRFSWISSRVVATTRWITGVFARGRSA
jgi:hypothetical protein